MTPPGNTIMNKSLFIFAVALGAIAPLCQAQVVVIVNPKNSATSATADEIGNLYSGKGKTLPGGGLAVLTDLPEGSPLSDSFYKAATGKSPAQVKATWAKLLFSGKATPPTQQPTAADVRRFVAANPDAIGYIDKASVDNTVKVLLALDK